MYTVSVFLATFLPIPGKIFLPCWSSFVVPQAVAATLSMIEKLEEVVKKDVPNKNRV
jgi:hypothetical protein